MCGIVYYKSFTGADVVTDLIWRYQSQRTRGTEGFGFYLPNLSKLVHDPSEDRILALLRAEEAPEVLYHHRMPTSTANVEEACHPFTTGAFFEKRYVLVHNGVIYNAEELKKEHEKLGIQYQSICKDGRFNDSEALLWDVALYLEGRQTELRVEGSVAFIAVEHDNSGRARKLHFARNRNPLYLQLDGKNLALASEAKWKEAEGAEPIMPNFLHSFVYASKNLTVKPLTISSYKPSVAPATTNHSSTWKSAKKDSLHYKNGPVITKQAAEETALVTLGKTIADIEKEIREEAAKILQRYIDESNSYDDAADLLVMHQDRTQRALSQMGALKYPKPKTAAKIVRFAHQLKVLIKAEELLFELMSELEELKADAKGAMNYESQSI